MNKTAHCLRLFLLCGFLRGLPIIVAIPFLHGCSTPSGPDDSGDANDELRAVSINRHAEFTAPVSATPLSDSENQSGWFIRNDLSDEFDGGTLDTRKWYVAGAPYVYNELPIGLTEDSDGSSADWLGRAPSVFDMSNYFIADGKLHLLVEWAPDSELFPVLDEEGEEIIDDECMCRYENFTVGGIISKSNMKYGYAEIRSRAAPVTVSSAFWMIGNHFEIDIFEMVGKAGDGPDGSGDTAPRIMSTTLHNWDIGGIEDNGYGEDYALQWNGAEDFHVYGAQWNEQEVIFYADGAETGRITQAEAGAVWNEDYLHVWADNEAFLWEGLPLASELPVSFDIDYIRVWQKP